MKRVLVFVLSCNLPPWDRLMQVSQETWDSENIADVPTVYYHGYPFGEPDSKVLQLPIPEGYYAINDKNMAAFRESLSWQWDYMARVNASCYVHKERLLNHVQSLPDTGVFQCVLADPTPNCGTTNKWPWGGMQFIFSRDVVMAMAANSGHLRHDMMEDAALGELAMVCGIIRLPVTLNILGVLFVTNRVERMTPYFYQGVNVAFTRTEEHRIRLNLSEFSDPIQETQGLILIARMAWDNYEHGLLSSN